MNYVFWVLVEFLKLSWKKKSKEYCYVRGNTCFMTEVNKYQKNKETI